MKTEDVPSSVFRGDASHAFDCGHAMGWMRDDPDIRDFTLDNDEVKVFRVDGVKKAVIAHDKVDVTLHDPLPQGKLSSCTAHAGTYLYELHQSVAGNVHNRLSRLFLYKVTRKLLGWEGDRGAHLRTTMQAMVTFGVPPEKFYEYRGRETKDDARGVYP